MPGGLRFPRPEALRGLSYAAAVDRLIPLAITIADYRERIRANDPGLLRWTRRWNRQFHLLLDVLCRHYGVRCQTWQSDPSAETSVLHGIR